MVNPHGQTARSQSESMKTDDKQKKQNTQNIPVFKPEIRITTWLVSQVSKGRKMAM